MIRSATTAKALALGLALAAHGALLLVIAAPEETMIDGAGGAAEVRLGSAFADMAAGTLTAERTATMSETAAPSETPPETAERIASETPDQTQEPGEPVPAAPAAPMTDRAAPVATPSVQADPATAAAPSLAIAALSPDAALPLTAQRAQDAEPMLRPSSPSATLPLKPVAPDPASPQGTTGAALTATALTIAAGAIDELRQAFLPHRSFEVADFLADALGAAGRPAGVFLQVDVAGEQQKFGVAPEGVRALRQRLLGYPQLTCLGLMAMAPLAEDPEQARPHFRALRQLRDDLNAAGDGPPLAGLSMGMSGDFEVAVEEGATHVRIGTALLDPRENRHSVG